MNLLSVSEKSGLPAKTIRYYEDIGFIRPDRRDTGYWAIRLKTCIAFASRSARAVWASLSRSVGRSSRSTATAQR